MNRRKLDKEAAFCEHKACHHPDNIQRKHVRVFTFENAQGNISQIYLVRAYHPRSDYVIWKNPDIAGNEIYRSMPCSSNKNEIKTTIMELGRSLDLSCVGTFAFDTEG